MTPEELAKYKLRPGLHSNHKEHQDYCTYCWKDLVSTCKMTIEKLTAELSRRPGPEAALSKAEGELGETRDNSATNWANWRKAEARIGVLERALRAVQSLPLGMYRKQVEEALALPASAPIPAKEQDECQFDNDMICDVHGGIGEITEPCSKCPPANPEPGAKSADGGRP